MEEVEGELRGEQVGKDVGGPGEAQTDELLVSGVWPENHKTKKSSNSESKCKRFCVKFNLYEG